MQSHWAQDLRRERRARVQKEGNIIFPRQPRPIDVVICDLTIGGARIVLPFEVDFPGDFEVSIPTDDFRCTASIRWRKQKDLGVQFIGPPRALLEPEAQDVISAGLGEMEVGATPYAATALQHRLDDYNKSMLYPEYRFAYEHDSVHSADGSIRVEVYLRNNSGFDAHQPFVCLPRMGLRISPAPQWDLQDIVVVRKMHRLAQVVVAHLAPFEAIHCCTLDLPLRTANGGRLEYQGGETHAVRSLPDLRLNCIAGAGNFPSNPMPLFVPDFEIKAFIEALVAAGKISQSAHRPHAAWGR